jgi:hypothetical protein
VSASKSERVACTHHTDAGVTVYTYDRSSSTTSRTDLSAGGRLLLHGGLGLLQVVELPAQGLHLTALLLGAGPTPRTWNVSGCVDHQVAGETSHKRTAQQAHGLARLVNTRT